MMEIEEIAGKIGEDYDRMTGLAEIPCCWGLAVNQIEKYRTTCIEANSQIDDNEGFIEDANKITDLYYKQVGESIVRNIINGGEN